jgi:hypothetical protein
VAFGFLGAPAPGGVLAGDRQKSRLTGFGLAGQPARRRLGFGEFVAPFGQIVSECLETSARLGEPGQLVQVVAGLRQSGFALADVGAQPLLALAQSGQAGVAGGGLLHQLALRRAGFVDLGESGAKLLPGRPLRAGDRGQPGPGFVMGGGGVVQGTAFVRESRAQLAQAVLLRQALGRGRRRVGLGGVAVPTPKVAGRRHQALTGRQLGLQAGAGLRVGDQADLRQAPGQHLGALYRLRHRPRAGGQRRRWFELGQALPAHRCGVLGRRAQIVAEGRAQGRLESAFDRHPIDHRRPALLILGLDQGGDGGDLGP